MLEADLYRPPSMLDGSAQWLQVVEYRAPLLPPASPTRTTPRTATVTIAIDDEGDTEMTQYAQIQARLLAKQAELAHRLERLKENLTAGRSADSQEQAQELENAEVVDALGNEARTEISLIARALDQIKNDTYGTCVDCGEQIPMARLEAYPFADRCIRCATAAESARRRR
jgi:RNA polymerase-binding transcription factor